MQLFHIAAFKLRAFARLGNMKQKYVMNKNDRQTDNDELSLRCLLFLNPLYSGRVCCLFKTTSTHRQTHKANNAFLYVNNTMRQRCLSTLFQRRGEPTVDDTILNNNYV